MNAQAISNQQPLSRQHYKRLRWYFQSADGAGSLADGIDLDLSARGLIDRVERFGGTVRFDAAIAAQN